MDLEFFTAVLVIIGIDIVLGGDNAIVIALASRNLPADKRNKAIFIGTGLAVLVRVLLTIVAVYLLKIPFLQLVGGLFLIYIAYSLIVEDDEDPSSIKAGTTLASAIRTIVFADIVMGFDNVIAIAGAAHGNIYLVIFGLIVSVPIIVWGSKLILAYMERFPFLVYIGAGILAYTAGSMITHEKRLAYYFNTYDYLSWLVVGVTFVLVIGGGWLTNKIKQS